MSKTINEAEWKEVSNFDKLISPIVDLVKDNWVIKAEPKCLDSKCSYEDYRNQYTEYDDLGDVKYALKFDGLLNTSASGFPINEMLTMPNVAYDDTQQGRDPIRTLLASVLSYGIAVGRRQEKTSPDNQFNESAIKDIQHYLECIQKYNTDAESIKEWAERASEKLKYDFKKR